MRKLLLAVVAAILLAGCSQAPPEPMPPPISSSAAALKSAHRIVHAKPAKYHAAGECESAEVALRKIGCVGLDNFTSTCRKRDIKDPAVDELPACLAAAKTKKEASACTPNFTCVVRK